MRPVESSGREHSPSQTTLVLFSYFQIEKCWIQYSEPFWEADWPKGFQRQWLVITNRQKDGMGTLWFNYNIPKPGTNILLGFVRGDMIEALGGKLNRAAIAKWSEGLRKLPGWRDDITWKFDCTDWSGNPNFDGSWEYWGYQKNGPNYKDLFDSIQPRGSLHLAGAAHCSRYWGFTWGAIVSGAHEAEWVARKMRKGDSVRSPYNPCFDPGVTTNPNWRKFYQSNPFFEP